MATSPSKSSIGDNPNGHKNFEQTSGQWNENPASNVAHKHNQTQSHHGLPQSIKQDQDSGYPKGPTFEKDILANEGANDQAVYQHQDSTKSKLPADFIDSENGPPSLDHSERDSRARSFSKIYLRYRIIFHLLIWLLFTGSVSKHNSVPLRLWLNKSTFCLYFSF